MGFSPESPSGGAFKIELVKRFWLLSVKDSENYNEILAGGEFRSDILQRCGIDTSRFSVVGLGLGLERLAMIRYAIDDIRAVRPAQ